MKRNTNIEIELPWQLKLVLMGVAVSAAALAVSLGLVIFEALANDSFQALLANFGHSIPTPFPFAVIWPLPLLAFVLSSIQFYFWLKRALIGWFSKLGP